MDILKYKPVDTIDVAIKYPDDTDTDITITVAGTHTAQWRTATAGYDSSTDTTGARLLAGATVGWQNLIEDGEQIEPTPDNIERVYLLYPWIRNQVEVAIGDKMRFFPNAANP
ncbi:MAG: hypothetical protein ACKO0Z_08350 [Betaproteobacteria bacterium]